MTITVEIPEELADQLIAAGKDPARSALEAIALEGYRNDRLGEAGVRRLLGFETRMEVHAFLKEHGVFLQFTPDDLAHDREVANQVAQRVELERQRDQSGRRRAG
jgi:GAF domain-containing protein